MQRNYMFLRGNDSFPHKNSDTLFCKRWLSDIQLPLHFIFFASRNFDARSVRKDDELVTVADTDNMVEVDQMRFVRADKSELGQHVLEMFERFAGNERSFIDQMDDRVVTVGFEAKDLMYQEKENAFTRRDCQAEVLDIPFVDIGGEIFEKQFALAEALAFGVMPFHRLLQVFGANGFQQVIQRAEPDRLDRVLVVGCDEDNIEIGVVGEL